MSNLSNWREEFNLTEVVTGKMTDDQALKKVDEKKNIKNKVTINPKLSEAVKEIGGEVLSIVETDTTAQKQRLDMKQMILDRQKLKLRRKDMSAAKQEKKQGVEGESTGALKQGNVIAAEEIVDVKKENEKKRKNALQIQKVIGEGDDVLENVLTKIGRTKKKVEKKPEKAMDAGSRAKRMLARKIHAKYVSGSTENVPDDIREEDKAFNFVLDKIKKEAGKSGYVSKNNPRKPQSDADKAKVRAHQAKVDAENAAERKKDPSQGRYPKG